MNKRKVAAMLAGMSAVGIVSNATTTAHATELDSSMGSMQGIYEHTSNGSVTMSKRFYEYTESYICKNTSTGNEWISLGNSDDENNRIRFTGAVSREMYDGTVSLYLVEDGYIKKSGNTVKSRYVDKWINLGNQTYYVDKDTSYEYVWHSTGYKKIDGKLYYFNEMRQSLDYATLYKTPGWVDNLGGITGRFYAYSSGELATGTKIINGVRYEFDNYGRLQTRTITLNVPSANVTINEGQAYDVMTGVASTDTAGRNANNKITTNLNGFNPDNPKPGTYTIEYTLSEAGQTKTARRTIVVTRLVDTEKPVINAPAISVVRGTADFDLKQGVTISDNVDSQADLLGKLVVDKGNFDINQAGTYQVTYKVTDSAGNESDTVTRTITVTPKTTAKPTISGANAVSIVQGTSFNSKSGVTATSAENEDLTSKITVSGTVNTNTPGTYELTYTVTDRDNNTTTVKRVVTVTAKPAANTLPTINVKMEHEIFVGDKFDPLAIATATDKEDGDVTSKLKVITNKVNVNKPGKYDVKYEVIDSAGGRRTKVITVIVKERLVTSKKPVISFPETTVIQTGSTFDPLAGVTAKDYKGNNITLTKANVAWNKVNTNNAGEYQVKYTVTDSEGNNKIVYRTVKVEGQATVKPPVTSKKPVISFPETTVIQTGSTFDPLAGVTAKDYKGNNITLTKANVAWNKVNTNNAGEYQVKYTVTDSEGNNKIVYRTVKVEGQATVKPPVTSKKPVINFPQTELQVGDTFDPLAGVTATDYKGQDIKLTSSNVEWNKVNTKTAGTYQVKYKVTDSEGNYKIAYRDVVVKGFTGLKGDASVSAVVMNNNTNEITVRGQVDNLTSIVNGTESDVSTIDSRVKYYLVAKDANGKEVFKNYMVRVSNNGSYSGFKTNLSLDELEKIQDSVTLSLVVETLNTFGELELGATGLNIVGEVQDTANNAKYTSTVENGKLKITKSQITRTSTNEETVTNNEENKVTEETKVDSNIDNSIENNEVNKVEEIVVEETIVEETVVEEITTENKGEASDEKVDSSNIQNEELTEDSNIKTSEEVKENIDINEVLEQN